MVAQVSKTAQATQHIQVVKSQDLKIEYGEGLERAIAIAPGMTPQADIYMAKVRIPHGSETTEAHAHINTHTAIYVEQGEVIVYYGANLEHIVDARQGDYIYIPPNVPHFPVNPAQEDLVVIVSRTPANQETKIFPEAPLPDIAEIQSLASQ
jgi:uncharacterized RmlC-like cupin family protein